MPPVVIRDPDSGSTAGILPQFGFNCYEFNAVVEGRTVAVIDASEEFPQTGQKPSGHGIPLLFPFPNRIRNGRFSWNGKDTHLPESLVGYNGDHAIHGFCLDRPWRVVDSGENYVTGEFRLSRDAPDRLPLWPADFVITVEYVMRDSTLECHILVANPSDDPLPWGFGTHPYFRLPLSKQSSPSQCLIEIPAAEEWELIDCLPTGNRRRVPEDKDFRDGEYYGLTHLDDVLTGLPTDVPIHETVIYDEAAGLQVSQRFGSAFREVVVYTPPNRDAVCIEPYTCVTDAVNLQQQKIDAGWRILEPGGEASLRIDISVGPIIV